MTTPEKKPKRKPGKGAWRLNSITRARKLLGDECLTALLRYLRKDDMSCDWINDRLDAGKSLDEILMVEGESGFIVEVKRVRGGAFRINVGYHAGPCCGSGTDRTVRFAEDGSVEDIGSVGYWRA